MLKMFLSNNTFHKIFMSIPTTIFLFVVLSIPSMQVQAKSPYDSGYDHGCDDASTFDKDKYIHQKGKGSSFHTEEFMNGYNAGFSDCTKANEDEDSTVTWE